MPAEPAYVPRMSPPAPMTADELLHAHLPDKRAELVRGVLRVREPAGSMHGRVAMNLGAELRAHAKTTDAGAVFAAETGFKLHTDPDTVRAPDVAFVAKGRVPPPDATGFAELAPDLVVEVLSPDDRPGEVLAKVADWLAAGTRLVWVVDPVRRVARVYRADGSEAIVTAPDALAGEDVLPGFTSPLASVLYSLPARAVTDSRGKAFVPPLRIAERGTGGEVSGRHLVLLESSFTRVSGTMKFSSLVLPPSGENA